MGHYIAVTRENRAFLRKTFKVSQPTIWRALNFADAGKETCNPTAVKIRSLALQRGGILMASSPWLETMHDADNCMRQYLPNGVMIEFDKNTGGAEIIKDGLTVKKYERVLISQIPAIQAEAQAL